MTGLNDDNRIARVVRDAAERLAPISDSARLDAEILLSRTIDMPRSYLFAHPEEELDDYSCERLDALIERRLDGEPMAYITGVREFWSLPLHVSPATLVPRPETEILVDLALRHIPRRADLRILDLGTGSGAIALAIARDRPVSRVTATDVSNAALAVARLNARELRVPNVRFVAGDWTQPVQGETFDVIVSNPPYVAADDEALGALGAEPRSALVAGRDGLDALRTLAVDCLPLAVAGGRLLLEHGAAQADQVAVLLEAAGWQSIETHSDYAGLPRVTTASKRD